MPWLTQAADMAVDLGRSRTDLTHMIDKMKEASRLCGKSDDAFICSRKYARFENDVDC